MNYLLRLCILLLLTGCNSAEEEVFDEDDLYQGVYESDYYVYNFSEYPVDFYMMNLRNNTPTSAIYKEQNFQQSIDGYGGFEKLNFKRSVVGKVGFAAFNDAEIKAHLQKWVVSDIANYVIIYMDGETLKLAFLARTEAVDSGDYPVVRLVSFIGNTNYSYKLANSELTEATATAYIPLTHCASDLQIAGFEFDFCNLEQRGYLIVLLPNEQLAIIKE
ncbi:hypothetical protein [Pseudoalteromonas gelatinilytica]|jgi:hypothetical protein